MCLNAAPIIVSETTCGAASGNVRKQGKIYTTLVAVIVVVVVVLTVAAVVVVVT